MPRRILFAVGQAGSADYLIPLWRRWLARNGSASWRVIASPQAQRRIEAAGIGGMPLVVGGFDGPDMLAAALGDWRPDLVFDSASGAAVETAAKGLGRSLGVPAVRLIDVWYGYRERLSANGSLDLPDKVLVIDDQAVRQAVGEGLPECLLEPVGHPGWEEIVPLPAGDRRHVMFASQPVARFYGERLGYTEASSWRMLVETARQRPDLITTLVFAPHPDDDMPPPAETGLVRVAWGRDALGQVGTVTGMFSSLMTNALLAGRHVISLQPNATGADKSNMGRERLIARATTPDELIAALTAPSPDLAELRAALKDSCTRLERALLAAAHG
jgi:hypothetical protein